MTVPKRWITPGRAVVYPAILVAIGVAGYGLARGPEPAYAVGRGFIAFIAIWMVLDGAALAIAGVKNLIAQKKDLPLLSTELFRLAWALVFLALGGWLVFELASRLAAE